MLLVTEIKTSNAIAWWLYQLLEEKLGFDSGREERPSVLVAHSLLTDPLLPNILRPAALLPKLKATIEERLTRQPGPRGCGRSLS